jgi:hypothetical protein
LPTHYLYARSRERPAPESKDPVTGLKKSPTVNESSNLASRVTISTDRQGPSPHPRVRPLKCTGRHGPLECHPCFAAPPATFYLALAGMVLAYLLLIEAAKAAFFAEPAGAERPRRRGHNHLVHRRAARFSTAGSIA